MKARMRKGRAAVTLLAICALGCNDRAAAGTRANDAPRPTAPAATATTSRPAKSPNAEVDELVRENLDAELVEQPITATWLGVHAWDDRVDVVTPEGQARQAARLRALLERLRAIDDKLLDGTHAFDRALLEHHADHQLYVLTELRPLEKNPISYCDLAQSA